MSVYVGSHPTEWRGKTWYHLSADTLEELHTFAISIGMKPAWFQNHLLVPHYDVTEWKRKKAIAAGAIVITRNEEAARLEEYRAKKIAQLGGVIPFDQPPNLKLLALLTQQTKPLAKCATKVICFGPHPTKDGNEQHGLELPLWLAFRCLYCGFWFCQSCAEIHFGETRIAHNTRNGTTLPVYQMTTDH